MSVQLPLFAGLGCPASVQLLDSVPSRCPAVQYLQDLLVQQMSSCWTVCPAVQYLRDTNVQQMSGCYLQDLVVQLLDNVSSRSPAVQYLPMSAVSVHWHVSHNAWLHAYRVEVCCKSASVHARNDIWRRCVYFVLHARCSVVRSVLNWHVWQHGGVDDATSTTCKTFTLLTYILKAKLILRQ